MTVDDVLLGWEDVCLNREITPIPPFTAGDRPMKIERVDDFTFRMVFDAPNGALPIFSHVLSAAVGSFIPSTI